MVIVNTSESDQKLLNNICKTLRRAPPLEKLLKVPLKNYFDTSDFMLRNRSSHYKSVGSKLPDFSLTKVMYS